MDERAWWSSRHVRKRTSPIRRCRLRHRGDPLCKGGTTTTTSSSPRNDDWQQRPSVRNTLPVVVVVVLSVPVVVFCVAPLVADSFRVVGVGVVLLPSFSA